MAVLSDADRVRVWRGLMRYWSAADTRETLQGILKADLRDAVNATDDWIDTNAAAFNTSLPLVVRTNLTAGQKLLLFCAVAAMRSAPALAIRIVGEID